MPRRIRYEDEEVAPPAGGVRPFLRSLLHAAVTLVVLAVMLYGAALAISRTGGFRAYVQADLSEAAGFEVALRDARLTPGLALVVEGVAAGRFDAPGTPCLQADRVVLGWSLFSSGGTRLRSLAVETGRLAFARSADGSWTPRPLAGAAEALLRGAGITPDAANPPAAPSLPSLRVTLRGVDVVWWKADRSRLASLAGLSLDVTPVVLPGRRLVHILAAAESVEPVEGARGGPLRIEYLWGGGGRIVLGGPTNEPAPPAGLGSIPGIGSGKAGTGGREPGVGSRE